MRIGWRGCVVSTLAVLVSAFAAVPAEAQSPGLTRKSLLSGVKFDASAPRVPSGRSVQQTGTEDQGIGVGVLAGIVRPKLTISDEDGEEFDDFFESRTGTMFGAWVGGNMNGRIGFTGEFIYVIRKTDVFFFDGADPPDELSFPAVEIPAVFHINFGPEDRGKGLFYVIAGPVFTFNLKEKIKENGEGDSIELEDDEGFQGADIGVLAGAGFEIFRVAFEVRHNWGLRNINSDGDTAEIKTKAWEFLVKFRFN